MKNNFKLTTKLNANSNIEIILKLTTKHLESILVNLSIYMEFNEKLLQSDIWYV